MPPEKGAVEDAKGSGASKYSGLDNQKWLNAQRSLIASIMQLSRIDNGDVALLFGHTLSPQAACILTGLVIMADWISSNQDLFPLFPIEDNVFKERFLTPKGEVRVQPLGKRFECAWDALGLLPCWRESTIALPSRDVFFEERFSFPPGSEPRPVQRAVLDIASSVQEPGLMIIEAPMGEGKTEAALAAAEVLACRSGRGGVCIALPTMATTDAMFGRVHTWLKHLPHLDGEESRGIYLAHGKSQLNEEFQGISRNSHEHYVAIGQDLDQEAVPEEVVVSEWMSGRKKGALANFLVCTVDQVLMGALEMKHLALRQLAYANKVVIIDECHAYDDYMQEYLRRVLEWMGSWNTPVILLSATLPEEQRHKMVDAYLRGRKVSLWESNKVGTSFPFKRKDVEREESAPLDTSRSTADLRFKKTEYPLVTYTSGQSVASHPAEAAGDVSEVRLCLMADDDESLVSLLKDRLSQGGCAGVVCDTVSRAQHAYRILADAVGANNVFLTHSRFIDLDRMDNERIIRESLGPESTTTNGRRPVLNITVGTQVLEQSLDIDFDVLVTDIAPTDLLLQRLGRVHRHKRGEGETDRPAVLRQARCYLRGIGEWNEEGPQFVRGISHVYDEASLLEMLAVTGLTGDKSTMAVRLPTDISPLVQRAYGSWATDSMPSPWMSRYQAACEERERAKEKKVARAHTWLLPSIERLRGESLVGMFKTPINNVGHGCRDDDAGQRAVRDTQETVEVMVLRIVDDEVRLLPWVGNPSDGVERGSVIRTDIVPSDGIARVAAQSAVRLPISICSPSHLDFLIGEIEKTDERWVGAWQESRWLAGRLALFFESDEGDSYVTKLDGWKITYARRDGLTFEKSTS